VASGRWRWAYTDASGGYAYRDTSDGGWIRTTSGFPIGFSRPLLAFALYGSETPVYRGEVDLSLDKGVVGGSIAPGGSGTLELGVANLGPDSADEVLVLDPLIEGLQVPAGTAPAMTQGSYDLASGFWRVGELPPGANATLSVPVFAVTEALAPCFTDTAFTDHLWDRQVANDRALILVRLPGVERCVNLTAVMSNVKYVSFECEAPNQIGVELTVQNRGPDTAREVLVAFSHNPMTPSYYFIDCPTPTGGSRCLLPELAADKTRTLNLISESFQVGQPSEQSLQVSVSSADSETRPVDNTSSRSVGLMTQRCLPIDDSDGFCFDACPADGGSGGSSSAGCFIATAAYGTPLDSRVEVLRRFRDAVLLQHTAGRWLVARYYAYSPSLAAHIAERPRLRQAVRWLLIPLIAVIQYPSRALLLSGLLGVILVRRRSRSR
jgi:hypothetical protein